MKPAEDSADRLLDALLREQRRNAADEPLLESIETALNVAAPAVTATAVAPAAKRRRHLLPPLAAAAAIILSIGAVAYWQAGQTPSAQFSQAPAISAERSAQANAAPAVHEKRSSELPKKAPLSRYADLWTRSGFSARPGCELPPRAEVTLDAAPAAPEANPQDSTENWGAFPPVPSLAKLDENSLRSGASSTYTMPDDTSAFGRLPSPPGALASNGGTSGGLGGSGSGFGKGTGAGMASGTGAAHGFGPASAGRGSSNKEASEAEKPSVTTPPWNSDNGISADKGYGKPFGKFPGNGSGNGGGESRDQYGSLVDPPWKSPWNDALSTFSIDVDAASYTNVRNLLARGRTVPPDAVRIEECINYFDYHYEGPKGDGPFAVHGTLATCPWKPGHLLARVAIKGREIDTNARPASNLVFLIDVSGSMQDAKKLPLLKRTLHFLLDKLDERDRLGIVVYAGREGVVLQPTTLDERGLSKAVSALAKLEAGGSTNGGAGLKRAYEMASQHIVEGGVNRVILATDGDFNVGTTDQGELVKLVKTEAAKGVSLTVLGFGSGNLNDSLLEAITNHGHGNYYYISGDAEAKRVFSHKLTGTLVTIAKDVKIQVEFNPGKVKAYRLIGYADRILRHEDFSNDRVEAGDIGAGHTVTAFYEIVPQGADAPDAGEVEGLRYQRPAGREAVPSADWFTLKLRHKHPEGDVSSLIETVVRGEPQDWKQAGNDFRFASAVALFGMKLRQMPEMSDMSWSAVEEIAGPAPTEDPHEQRAGFIEMVRKLAR